MNHSWGRCLFVFFLFSSFCVRHSNKRKSLERPPFLMAAQQFAETYDSEDSVHNQYFDGYGDMGVHRVMLTDEPRMTFFYRALSCPSVVAGRVVVDVGSGTGILAMWAAKTGARHVFSIEASPLRLKQAQVIADNNLTECITLLESTVEDVVAGGAAMFAEKYNTILKGCGVALIVSEWMGFYLLHEGMLPSVLRARDFFAAVNDVVGVHQPIEMLPDRASIIAAPMNCQPYYEERYQTFWATVGGLDFSHYGRAEYGAHLESAQPLVDTVPSACLLHEGVELVSWGLSTATAAAVTSLECAARFDFSKSTVFQEHLAKHNGRVVVDGFTLWFDVQFREWTLSTSPCCLPTHWKQTTVLFPESVRREGLVSFSDSEESLDVALQIVPTDESLRCYRIEVELK